MEYSFVTPSTPQAPPAGPSHSTPAARPSTISARLKQRRVSLPSTQLLRSHTQLFRDEMALDPAEHPVKAEPRDEHAPAAHSARTSPSSSVSPVDAKPVKKQRKKWTTEETQMLVDGCNEVCSSHRLRDFRRSHQSHCSGASATGRPSSTTLALSSRAARRLISRTGKTLADLRVFATNACLGSAPTFPTRTASTTPMQRRICPRASARRFPTAPLFSRRPARKNAVRFQRKKTKRSAAATSR